MNIVKLNEFVHRSGDVEQMRDCLFRLFGRLKRGLPETIGGVAEIVNSAKFGLFGDIVSVKCGLDGFDDFLDQKEVMRFVAVFRKMSAAGRVELADFVFFLEHLRIPRELITKTVLRNCIALMVAQQPGKSLFARDAFLAYKRFYFGWSKEECDCAELFCSHGDGRAKNSGFEVVVGDMPLNKNLALLQHFVKKALMGVALYEFRMDPIVFRIGAKSAFAANLVGNLIDALSANTEDLPVVRQNWHWKSSISDIITERLVCYDAQNRFVTLSPNAIANMLVPSELFSGHFKYNSAVEALCRIFPLYAAQTHTVAYVSRQDANVVLRGIAKIAGNITIKISPKTVNKYYQESELIDDSRLLNELLGCAADSGTKTISEIAPKQAQQIFRILIKMQARYKFYYNTQKITAAYMQTHFNIEPPENQQDAPKNQQDAPFGLADFDFDLCEAFARDIDAKILNSA